MTVRESDGTGWSWRNAVAGRRRWLAVTAGVAAASAAALIIGACTGSSAGSARRQAPVSAAQLTITPADSSQDANPSQGVSVTVTRGTLENVTVTKGSDPVGGVFSTGRSCWHSTWSLLPARDYTVNATAVFFNDMSFT